MPQIKCDTKGVSINYRHIITSLLRKPGAFANYYYREHFFPTTIFRIAYDALIKNYPINGTKQYLQILQLAAIGSESEISTALDILINNKVVPSYNEVQELINSLYLAAFWRIMKHSQIYKKDRYIFDFD